MSQPFVYITGMAPEEAIEIVRAGAEVEVWPEDRPVDRLVLLEKVRSAEGLYCLLTDRVDDELLDAAPRLKVVSNMAVGYDNIDVQACTRRGIPVGNTPGVLTETTADLAFALMLAAARRITEAERFVRAGRWTTWSPMLLTGHDVHSATVGIIGMGRIGLAFAQRCRGFDMRILYANPTSQPDADALGAQRVDQDMLLAESDFVSLHCPLTPETRHLVGAAELRKMKPTAILINSARGPIVDQRALYEALRDGIIAYAGLDVTDPEPIAVDDPLLTLDNVIILPHIGSASVATRTRMAVMAAENVVAGVQGKRLPNCVNPEVYEASQEG